MSSNKSVKFECRECGGGELGYQKYVKCITPVMIKDDNNLEYGQSIIDEDDYLATLNGFSCSACKTLIEHCGVRVETERQLIGYLSMEPFDRQHQQQEYEELLDAQIYAQEQKEKELANMSAIMESE